MLQAGAIVFDETGEQVDREEMRRIYEEYADLITYLDDWESGLIAPPTRAEYDAMPEIIIEARRIFRDALNKFKQAKGHHDGSARIQQLSQGSGLR